MTRCHTCGFRSEHTAFFREDATGLLARPRPVCMGCDPVRPTGDERLTVGLFLGSSLLGSVLAVVYWAAGGGPTAALVVAALVLGRLIAALTHETGHAVASIALGARLLSVQIGSGPPLAKVRIGGAALGVGRYPIGGQTIYVWPSLTHRWRELTVALAGPGLNLILGGLLILPTLPASAAFPVDISRLAVAGLIGLGLPQIASGLLNLLPVAPGTGRDVTDGRHALDLLRPPAAATSLPVLILGEARRHALFGHNVAAAHAIRRAVDLLPDQPVLLAEAIRFISTAEGHASAMAFCRAQSDQIDTAMATTESEGQTAAAGLKARIAWSALNAAEAAGIELANRLSLEALETAPGDPFASGVRGAVLLDTGDPGAARPLLLQAVRGEHDAAEKAAFCERLSRLMLDEGDRATSAAFDELGRWLRGASSERSRPDRNA